MELYWTILETDWGFAGFSADKKGIKRFILPVKDIKYIENTFQNQADFKKDLLPRLAREVFLYFKGKKVDFSDFEVDLGGLTDFSKKVLNTCRKVSYGKTITYAELSIKSGRKNSARPAANVLAGNPVPLIIPCHRIIRSDGQIGGFLYGTDFKRKMIELESRI